MVRDVMLEIRTVRYATHACRIPVRALCSAFDGAGAAVLAASGHRRAGRREEAFRDLVEGWIRKGGAGLAPWFAGCLRDLAGTVRGSTREWVTSLMPLPEQEVKPVGRAGSEPVAEAELRLVKYVAAHARYRYSHTASVLVQLAVPPPPGGEGWRLRGLEIEKPSRFRLSDAAFRGATHPRLTGSLEAVRSLALSGDTLAVSTEEHPRPPAAL
jgi:hypothetical protein